MSLLHARSDASSTCEGALHGDVENRAYGTGMQRMRAPWKVPP